MDLRAEFERVIAEMEWEELVQTIEEMIAANGWADPPNPPFQPPLYPPFPASHTYSRYVHLTDQSGQIYSPAAAYGHGQYDNIPVVKISEATYQNLVLVGMLNGDLVYMVPTGTPSVPAAAPLTTPKSNKRKRGTREDGEPYIKKPPNAFMVFRKKQAPIVAAELPNSNSAQVNAVVGQRWKALSKEEQAKYYEEAQMENLIHIMNHPDWSTRDNYGKKRKRVRVRRKAPTRPEASTSKPEEVTQQTKQQCVTSMQAPLVEPSSSQPGVIKEPSTIIVLMKEAPLATASEDDHATHDLRDFRTGQTLQQRERQRCSCPQQRQAAISQQMSKQLVST